MLLMVKSSFLEICLIKPNEDGNNYVFFLFVGDGYV